MDAPVPQMAEAHEIKHSVAAAFKSSGGSRLVLTHRLPFGSWTDTWKSTSLGKLSLISPITLAIVLRSTVNSGTSGS